MDSATLPANAQANRVVSGEARALRGAAWTPSPAWASISWIATASAGRRVGFGCRHRAIVAVMAAGRGWPAATEGSTVLGALLACKSAWKSTWGKGT